MSRVLLVTVRLHDGRYHGVGDWPPSPARLFQALVAGAGVSGPLGVEDRTALTWLEDRDPPLIGAPTMWDGQSVMFYMPNNDLDAVGGSSRRIAEIRTAKKFVRPRTFDATIPFLYAWALGEDPEASSQSHAICKLADRLYQFGRGVDMAWAVGQVLEDEELDAELANFPGLVYRPSPGGSARTLKCPQQGSLTSLVARHSASAHRFETEVLGKVAKRFFSQPPKPHLAEVAYESSPSRRLYELRDGRNESSSGVWPLARASRLAIGLRDGAVERLRRVLSDRRSDVERVLVGRKADGADEGPASARVRIIPLPSIGHPYADREIRRVLVEVPSGGSLLPDDVHWAFSGLSLIDSETGEDLELTLIPSSDKTMPGHYGVGDRLGFRTWRTVTPAALPKLTSRRRIDPARIEAEAKDGVERSTEHARAAGAAAQALRHAEIRSRPQAIRVQREPFEARGERVEAFASGTRFSKHRLWHVEVSFDSPISGPLVIGDGRFLGLGVMAPIRRHQNLHVFVVNAGLAAIPQPAEVARALRRAVMARVQQVLGSRARLPRFFSGHEPDGSPARAAHQHLTFVFDPAGTRLLILAPHLMNRRPPTRDEIANLTTLEAALVDFRDLRAASSGRLTLRTGSVEAADDPLFAPSRTWESLTPYQVTRHTKHVDAAEALSADLRAECRRLGLPEPCVTPRRLHGVSGVGLVGEALLTFAVAVEGPLILGRSRHLGGGLFAATSSTGRPESLPPGV